MRQTRWTVFGIPILFLACQTTRHSFPPKSLFLNDLSKQQFKGPVKTYKETPYKMDSSLLLPQIENCCIAVVSYDKEGNHVRTIVQKSDGVIQQEQETIGRYANGLSKGDRFIIAGKVTSWTNWETDRDGLYIAGKAFDSTGKITALYEDFKLNQYGQEMQYALYSPERRLTLFSKREFTGALLTARTDKDSSGKIRMNATYQYNNRNELVQTITTRFIKDSSVTTNTYYAYDKHDRYGNWTERIVRNHQGIPIRLNKREITYYE